MLPIENATCKNQKSDKNGFLYLDLKNEKEILINKEGYQDCVVILGTGNKISLTFMKKIIFDPKNNLIHKTDFNLIYNSNEININLINPESLDILSFPVLNNINYKINSGFYLKTNSKLLDTDCTVDFLKNDLKIIYFNIDSLKWDYVELIKKDNKIISIIKQEGYYFIILKNEIECKNIKINKNNYTTSNIYFKDKKTNFYFQYNISDPDINLITLPKNDFELLIFTPLYPFDILQEKFTNINDMPAINLKNLTKDKTNEERLGFYHLFNGIWKRRGISFNNKIIQENKIKFENLRRLKNRIR